MITLIVLLGILLLWIAGSKLVLRNIEILGYEVLQEKDQYEIRKYTPYLVAQTKIPENFNKGMNSGFRVLADYIFGNNTKNQSSEEIAMTTPVIRTNEEIAMTSPVITQSESIAMTSPVIREKENRVMEFVLPAKYTLETLPKPNNDAVKIVERPGGMFAAVRYTGLATESRRNKYQNKLINALEKDKVSYDIDSLSEFFYDPPSTFPWVRRNEVLIEIEQ